MKRSIKVLCYYDATLPVSDPELGQQDLAQCHFDLRNEKKTPAAVDSPDPHSISRKDFALIQAHTCTHTLLCVTLCLETNTWRGTLLAVYGNSGYASYYYLI
jgi:hypothetical protein